MQMKVGTDNKLNKRYAFVLLETEDLAQQALKEMNNITIEDTNEKLYVNLAQPREVRRREIMKNNSVHKNDTNLFIKSLLQNVTEENILEVFGKYGTKPLIRQNYFNCAKRQNCSDKGELSSSEVWLHQLRDRSGGSQRLPERKERSRCAPVAQLDHP